MLNETNPKETERALQRPPPAVWFAQDCPYHCREAAEAFSEQRVPRGGGGVGQRSISCPDMIFFFLPFKS